VKKKQLRESFKDRLHPEREGKEKKQGREEKVSGWKRDQGERRRLERLVRTHLVGKRSVDSGDGIGVELSPVGVGEVNLRRSKSGSSNEVKGGVSERRGKRPRRDERKRKAVSGTILCWVSGASPSLLVDVRPRAQGRGRREGEQGTKDSPDELPGEPQERLLEVVVRLGRDLEVLEVLLSVESDGSGLDLSLLLEGRRRTRWKKEGGRGQLAFPFPFLRTSLLIAAPHSTPRRSTSIHHPCRD